MPRRYPDSRPWVFQRLVLQPRRLESEDRAEGEQPLLVRAHQVHHRLPAKSVAMKPHAAVEGEAHPLAAACEFTVRRGFWQGKKPSKVTGTTGGGRPQKKGANHPRAGRTTTPAGHNQTRA